MEKSFKLSITDLEKEIRSFVENPRILDPFSKNEYWRRYDISLWIICDYQKMIDYIIDNQKEDLEYEEKHFLVIGLLQALYVQQDALKTLCEALYKFKFSLVENIFNNLKDMKNSFQEVYDIRDLRNRAIGHPTDKAEGKTQITSNVLLWDFSQRGSFEVRSYDNQDQVNMRGPYTILDLVSKQKEVVRDVLQKNWDALQKEDQMHREKYRDQKLVDLLPDRHLYRILQELISEENQRRDGNNELRTSYKIIMEDIRNPMKTFKKALEERGYPCGPTDENYGKDLHWFELALREIERYFERTEADEKVFLFCDYLILKMDAIKKWAQKIDEEYSN